MISHKYVIDKQDDRDGGKTVVLLSVIDNATGANTRLKIAVFEERVAADAYVVWMNTTAASKGGA